MNILNEDGVCQKCNHAAQSGFMQCWICKDKYHVIDCEADPMMQASFVKNMWQNMLKNWPSLTFTCPTCRENMKTKEESIMSARVRLLEENVLKSDKKLENIMELLTKLSNQPELTEKPKSYSDIVAADAPSAIVIDEPGEEQESGEERQNKIEAVTKAAIQAKAGVKKSFTTKEGKTVLVCSNTKSKDALLPHVQKVYGNRKISTPKARLPTINVPFIQGKFEKEELLDVLCLQNEEIMFTKDNTEIVYFLPMRQREGQFQAVIRVAENIRDQIKEKGNRLCIGINSCPVYDRFFVKRCNQCQELGHFHKDKGGCKNAQVCALCSGNHDTRRCEIDENQYKCVNCVKAEHDDVSHAANSLGCRCYVAEQEKLKKSINYYQKNS